MRILMIGDVVGGSGRLAVTRVVGRLRQAGDGFQRRLAGELDHHGHP